MNVYEIVYETKIDGIGWVTAVDAIEAEEFYKDGSGLVFLKGEEVVAALSSFISCKKQEKKDESGCEC